MESGFSHAADGNNHLAGFTYDPAGNTSGDTVYSNYVWDGEGQLKSANGTTYASDGDGRRVAKVGSKLYWYGSGGNILAETTASGTTTAEYIFFGGKRIAMLPASSTPIYYVEDMLGTSRVITSNTGVVCYDADFYPYGGERPYTNTCPQNYKFEGKERDTETGNDDFGARYYSNRFGRWLSADWSSVPVPVPYANLTNPQTLNLYAMVSDDPESFADLDGHCNPNVPNGCGGGQFDDRQKLPMCECQNTAQAPKQNAAQPQGASILKKAEQALDTFNGTLGFAKSNCAGGSDCINALGMAATAIIAAVASGGESEEAFVEKQISTAGPKIERLAAKLTEDTLESANREVNGGMKVAKAGGGFFDHAEKVKQVMNGLNKQAAHLERVLQRRGLSESQVSRINGLIEGARNWAGTALEAITPKETL